MNSFSFESLFPGEKMGREAPALPFSFHIHQFLNLKKEEEGAEEAELQEDKITTSQKEAEDEDKTVAKVSHSVLNCKEISILCIPRKGIARPQSQCLHSRVCERSIFLTIGPPIFLQQNRQTDLSWKYINRSQKHECRN